MSEMFIYFLNSISYQENGERLLWGKNKNKKDEDLKKQKKIHSLVAREWVLLQNRKTEILFMI